ncbi:MAG: DUF4153 domain-containing protein [Bacteroidales bacterium]|nr:DUF4153 domain-containing protein [Bacteroidales bacterium]
MNITDNKQDTSKSLFKRLFSNFGEKLQTALVRFPMTFVSIIAVAILMVTNIRGKGCEIDFKWVVAGVISAFATLAFYLFAEKKLGKLLTNGINLLLMGALVWFCSTLPKQIPDANVVQLVMIGGSFVLALFFAGSIGNKNSLLWWNKAENTLFNAVISAVFAGILMGGLSLALVSLDKLFGITIKENVYEYLAVFCFILFMPSYFMAQILTTLTSDESTNVTYPAIYKVLGLYILLPILAIYTVILYGYLIKIIATWELPNGWVSWLVSVLGFAGFLTMIILHPLFSKGENKTTNLFSRIFPLILFPLLLLMMVGIIRRFSDYGITINRLLVLILNLWFFGISIYLFISRSRQPKWILISFAIVALLSAVGPWNVINVTEKSLKKEFSQLLAEASWTNSAENKIVPLKKEKQQRIYDVAYYLQRTYGVESIRPMFSVLGEKATMPDLIKALGIKNLNSSAREDFYFSTTELSIEIGVENYKKAIYLRKLSNESVAYKSADLTVIFENENLKIEQNGETTLISLEPVIQKTNIEDKMPEEPQIIDQDNVKLMITYLSGYRNENGMSFIESIEGLLLLK